MRDKTPHVETIEEVLGAASFAVMLHPFASPIDLTASLEPDDVSDVVNTIVAEYTARLKGGHQLTVKPPYYATADLDGFDFWLVECEDCPWNHSYEQPGMAVVRQARAEHDASLSE